MSGNPSNFSVLPWSIPKSVENFVPEYSRFFVFDKYRLFFSWRCNLSLLFTFNVKDSLSLQKPIQSQMISSREPILDILLIDDCIYFVSPSGLFQVLSCTDKKLSGKVLKNLEKCKTFLLSAAFHLSAVKKVLSVISVEPSLHNCFAVVTYSQDNGSINAELYSVSQKNTSQIEPHLKFSSNICNENSPQKMEKCTCYFVGQSQAASLFSDCKDADVLLVGLSSGQLFCVPFLLSANKLGIRPIPRLIFQSLWSIIGVTCPPDASNIFVFLQGETVLKISPLLQKSGKSVRISLSYSSFTLPHPVKHYLASTCDQLIVSDSINSSLIHIISHDQTQVDMISVKGITAMSAVLEDNLIIASTAHGVFYMLNTARNSKKELPSHLPWTGCDLDLSLQLVQDMKAQTTILSQLRTKLKEEDCLIKALSSVSRSSLMTKHFVINVKVFSNGDQSGQSTEETEHINDVSENTNQKFFISVQIHNNSLEDFPSSLWNMGVEFRSSDGLMATKNMSLSRNFSSDFPFCARFTMPFPVEISSFPLELKAFLLAEIKNNEEEIEWLKISLGTAVMDVSHFVSVCVQTPQTPEVHDIVDCINQIHSTKSEPVSQTEKLQDKSFVFCIVQVPEELRQHNIIVDKILSNCHNSTAKEFFSNQSDKTVIWLKFLHKTLSLVFRKSCSSITMSSAHLDFFNSFKLHLTSVLKEDCKTDCDTERSVACIKAKSLTAVLETLSLEETLDPKKVLAVYQDLRNNVSPQMY